VEEQIVENAPSFPQVPEANNNEPILPEMGGNRLEDYEWMKQDWEAKQLALRLEYEQQLQERSEKQRQLNQTWTDQRNKLKASLEEQQEKLKAFQDEKAKLQ